MACGVRNRFLADMQQRAGKPQSERSGISVQLGNYVYLVSCNFTVQF